MRWKSKKKLDPVRRAVTVNASQERAFAVFTAQFGGWWPPENSAGGRSGIADIILEPDAGGRWYEVGVDGKETDAGSVLESVMPERLVLAWQRGGDWNVDPDPGHASEVEVRFIQAGPQETNVELEHRSFERHGADAGDVHGLVDGPQGWSYCLEQFAKQAAA